MRAHAPGRRGEPLSRAYRLTSEGRAQPPSVAIAMPANLWQGDYLLATAAGSEMELAGQLSNRRFQAELTAAMRNAR